MWLRPASSDSWAWIILIACAGISVYPEVPFNEDADIDDFGITVYERVGTESFSNFIDVSGVSFQR